MKIVSAKIYIGSGLETDDRPVPRRFTRHRLVIDPREISDQVERLISNYFDGATISQGRGRWQGRGEPSLVVDIWEKSTLRRAFFTRVMDAARELADVLDQLTIAVVTTDANGVRSVAYLNDSSHSPRAQRRRQGVSRALH